MLILLPPSETKAGGGEGPPLDLARLSWPGLNEDRARVLGSLRALNRSPRRAAEVLGLGPRQHHELEHNARLLESPTMPAIERYTGVLFDALDVRGLSRAERARAGERLAVGSALFGLLRADDAIPAYRLSAGTTLPRIGTLGRLWKPALVPLLAEIARQDLVVDLRSGAYRSLAPVEEAVTVRVLTERPDGSRAVVSHFNKATKGLLARMLGRTSADPATAEDVARIARRGGLRIEQQADRVLDVISG